MVLQIKKFKRRNIMKKLNILSITILLAFLISGCDFTEGTNKMKVENIFADKQTVELVKYADDDDRVKASLKNNTDINARGKDNITPLIFSYLSKDKKAFEVLLKNGANPNLKAKGDISVMSLSARDEDIYYLKMALKYGGDANLQTYDSQSVLMVASSTGNLENVKLLLKHKARINHQDKLGYTALIMATSEVHVEVVRYLLKNGADKTLNAGKSLTAYKTAQVIGHKDLMEILR